MRLHCFTEKFEPKECEMIIERKYIVHIFKAALSYTCRFNEYIDRFSSHTVYSIQRTLMFDSIKCDCAAYIHILVAGYARNHFVLLLEATRSHNSRNSQLLSFISYILRDVRLFHLYAYTLLQYMHEPFTH